jgi:hypothetical protein
VRAIAGGVVGALLLAGCAASGPTAPGPVGSGSRSEPSPAQLRQTVEDLGREVRDLRAQVEASRRVAVGYQDLAGLRAELEAVQTALQALIRDIDQRQLEGFQAMDRRLAAIGGRISELAAATRSGPAEGPPAASPPAGPARVEPPPAASAAAPRAAAPVAVPAEPAKEPAEGSGLPRGRTIQRVSTAEVSGETRVSVQADGPLTPRVSALGDPPRVVLDFENAAFGFGRTPVEVEGPLLERIRFIQLQGAPTPVIRVLLTLKRPVPYWVESQARGLIVHLGSAAPR